MDDSPMSHALGAAEFADNDPREGKSAGATARLAPLPWRNYTRCFLLVMVLGMVGYIAFRPGLLRLSILMSLVSPSRGESLAWKPDEEEDARLAPVKFNQPPAEWRLAAVHSAGWFGGRPEARDAMWQGGRLGASPWRRDSFNPWSWSDDVARNVRRNDDPSNGGPGQKPASSFRAKDTDGWALAAGFGSGSEISAVPAANGRDAAPAASAFSGAARERVPSVIPLVSLPGATREPAGETAQAQEANESGSVVQSLLREAAEFAALPAGIASTSSTSSASSTSTAASSALERIVSEPISLGDISLPALPPAPAALRPPETAMAPSAPVVPTAPVTPIAPAAPTIPSIPAAPIAPSLPATLSIPESTPASGTISPSEALSAAFAVAPETRRETPATTAPVAPTAPTTQTPSAVPVAPAAPADWKEREITGPIPGAYLTIYPKLKFIGLCVPGQGYIRKYNQIAVPMDSTQPKQHAADGRTPYGKYYVAAHVRDISGPRVVLSWPSVDDARRGGVGPEMISVIERAWRQQEMPPQNTMAGGNVSLSGDRDQLEYTSGGFSLEVPHMEEIFTALPDGAWVFVQQ